MILLACNFDFNKIRGQCYDKAASMSGEKTGVKTQILIENPKALWIHCLNHANVTYQYVASNNVWFISCFCVLLFVW